MELTREDLMTAARSFAGCGHKGLTIYTPNSKDPQPGHWRGTGVGWIVECAECCSSWGKSDSEIVIRALVLKALGATHLKVV